MGFSQVIDWSNELRNDYDKWINHGRNIAKQSCKHKNKDDPDTFNMEYCRYCEECGYSEDSQEPMMNFGYPLEMGVPNDEKIKEIIDNTNCTIMENEESGESFIVLTGGGMDLSQDIALAFTIAEKWIPSDLAREVCTQYGLSISGKNWFRLMEMCKQSLKNEIGHAETQIKRIDEVVKKARGKK